MSTEVIEGHWSWDTCSLLAVQWHPKSLDDLRLFKALVDASGYAGRQSQAEYDSTTQLINPATSAGLS